MHLPPLRTFFAGFRAGPARSCVRILPPAAIALLAVVSCVDTPPTAPRTRPSVTAEQGGVAMVASAEALTSESTRLLWQKLTTGERSVWLMTGTSWPGGSSYVPYQVPSEWSIVGVADFNRDGFGDILWENSSTRDHSIWFMDGDNWSGQYLLLPTAPAGWSVTAVGDFNGDEHQDLIWVNETGERSIWFMKGTSVAGYGGLPKVDPKWRIAGTGDFNRDGQTDLVWENLSMPRNMRRSIWFMNGSTWTNQYVLLNAVDVPDGWSIAAVGDFNADAKPDLVWQNMTTGERTFWLMNGTSIGSYANLTTVSDLGWSIAAVLAPTRRPGHWTTNAEVTTARYYSASGVIGGVLYVAGGTVSGTNTPSQINEAYDPATNSWSMKAAMLAPRTSAASAVVGGILYVMGGINAGAALATVEAYNPASNSWTTKAPMPAVRYGAVAGVVNGIIYVAGGAGPGPSGYTNAVYAYDPVANAWTTKASMATGLAYSAGAVVDGILYLAGGYGYSGSTIHEAYDPVADSWSFKAPMPTQRESAAAVAINGLIYVFGGGNFTGELGTMDVYIPAANVWKTQQAMPVRRYGLVAGVVNGVIYTVGSNYSTERSVLAFFP
jgi:N-acetylneuraminic acid mutarotase